MSKRPKKREPFVCKGGFVNKEEFEVAEILEKNKLNFEYSKKFYTIKILDILPSGELVYPKESDPNFLFTDTLHYREVDFYLEQPITILGCNHPVQALEVKSSVSSLGVSSWCQRRELRDSAKIDTFITLPQHIRLWQRYGLIEFENKKKKKIHHDIKILRNMRLKMVKILMNHGIRFEVNVPVETKKVLSGNSLGVSGHQTNIKEIQIVDFMFAEPVKVFWSSIPIKAIVITDELDLEVLSKMKSLENAGISAFPALPQYIGFWENKFFRSEE